MASIPVYVWLPQAVQPTLAGSFSAEANVCRFVYDAAYRAGQYPPLAPDMPCKTGTVKLAGVAPIFPVLQDGGPDDWGTMQLERKLGRKVSRIEALTLGPADGAGNIVLGELGQARFAPVSISEFEQLLSEVDQSAATFAVNYRERVMQAVFQGTSLGGGKPKLTLQQDGVQYIAKFPDRGDDPYLPQLELAMLRLAKACGIDACEAQVIEPAAGRFALLVKRFDRQARADGVARIGYVSAWSVLRLDQIQARPADLSLLGNLGYTPDMHQRSYVSFASHMVRWLGPSPAAHRQSARELWRRIVFNALIRNTDDHPRNHGLLCDCMLPQQWRLAPAFDLVAQRAAGPVPALAMAYRFERPRGRLSQGSRLVSAANRADLLAAAVEHYGYDLDEASAWYESARALVRGHWQQALLDAGMPAPETQKYAATLGTELPDTPAG